LDASMRPAKSSRDRLVVAARAEFARAGFAGARVDRIAAEAGLNKQLIYYYFGSKAGLFAAATQADLPAGTAATSPTTVREAVTSLLGQLANRPDLVRLLTDPDVPTSGRKEARAWVRAARDGVAAVISRGQGNGLFRDDVDPLTLAHQAVVLCAGFLAMAERLEVSLESWSRTVGDSLTRAATW